MNKEIDFTSCRQKLKAYGGANGNKICIVYNDEDYMLKFPPPARKNEDMSYSNGCFSEYLGSKIFESTGIQTQKVLIGTYNFADKEKIVVACKDFTRTGILCQDFASLKNSVITTENKGYGTELEEILDTIDEQKAIDQKELSDFFWDMFIIDALIGNWDRHNGNWGFLYDTISDSVELAPIYDCGSSLFPQANDVVMKSVLADEDEKKLRIYEIPTSAIRINGKKINYYGFITSASNKDCNKALIRMLPQIDINKIDEIILNTPFLSDLQKDFYSTMLALRKEKILEEAMLKINKIYYYDAPEQ